MFPAAWGGACSGALLTSPIVCTCVRSATAGHQACSRCNGVQGPTRSLQAIIGQDNRQRVVDMSYPHTAIGQLQFVEAGGGNFLCTGTLFTERHVLTCAHCVYDSAKQRYNRDWIFVPALSGSKQPFGLVECVPLFRVWGSLQCKCMCRDIVMLCLCHLLQTMWRPSTHGQMHLPDQSMHASCT